MSNKDRKEIGVPKISLILAVITTAPLLLSQLGLLMFHFDNLWSYDSWLVWIWGIVAPPLIFAYYFLWTPAGMIYLVICLATILWAWRKKETNWKTLLLLVLASTVTLLGIIYDIWWYLTGQVFEQLA
jgi:hypothetical protein